MKTCTYTKTGKSEIQINNLKTGENLMKTATYKRTGKGIVEITNENNNLEDLFLMAYNQAYSDIKRGRYTFTLENLQDAITAILERIETIELDGYQAVYHYLISACSRREKTSIRQAMSLDLMKNIQCEYFIENSGISDVYISEILLEIKRILTLSELEIFNLYHVEGYTQKEIAEKLDTYRIDILRKLDTINRKIENLKVSYFFDCMYVAYQSQKKKRQHKRKVLQHKDYIALSGSVIGINKTDYKEQKPLKLVNIPANKALQYPTINYFIREKNNTFDYYNAGKETEYVSTLTYTKSKLSVETRLYSAKNYRLKKSARIYKRTLKIMRKEKETRELFKGHRSRLFKDGIQS